MQNRKNFANIYIFNFIIILKFDLYSYYLFIYLYSFFFFFAFILSLSLYSIDITHRQYNIFLKSNFLLLPISGWPKNSEMRRMYERILNSRKYSKFLSRHTSRTYSVFDFDLIAVDAPLLTKYFYNFIK